MHLLPVNKSTYCYCDSLEIRLVLYPVLYPIDNEQTNSSKLSEMKERDYPNEITYDIEISSLPIRVKNGKSTMAIC